MGVAIETIDILVDRIVRRVGGICEVISSKPSDSHLIFRKKGIDLSDEEEFDLRQSVEHKVEAVNI